jgi:hypothetical protein
VSILRFEAVVEAAGQRGGSASIKVPADAATTFGSRSVTSIRGVINGFTFRSSIFPTGEGDFYLVLNREVRAGARVQVGDRIQVTLEKDLEPRTLDVPEDFQQALDANPEALAAFARLSYTHQKEYIQWMESAKREATRQRRVASAVEKLKGGLREPH